MKSTSRATAGQYAILALVVVALVAQLVINRQGTAAPSDAEPVARPVSTSAIDWTRVTERDLNIASVFLMARDGGVRAALDSLERLAANDGELRAQGHPLAHALGRYAMATRKDLAVLGECTPSFQSGCFHGALEGYFLQGGTIERASAGRICASRAAQGSRGFELLECWHGLGHGLMVHYDGDFRQALPICDALDTPVARRECYDGIFMERAIRAVGTTSINVGDGPGMGGHAHGGQASAGGGHEGHGAPAPAGQASGGHEGHGAAPAAPAPAATGATASAPSAGTGLSRAERGKLCEGLEARHAPSCWAYQPIVLFTLHGLSATAVLRACDGAPAGAVRDCYQGFGKQYLGALGGNAREMIAGCQQGNRAHATDCMMGGVEYFTDLDWTIEPGIGFCRQVPGDAKPRCYEMIGARLALAHPAPEPIRAACRQVESAFVGACMTGAGLRES
jgi:hypothetical protein